MEESPIELLKHDLLGYFDMASALNRRNDELVRQEAEFMARREAAQSAGVAVDDLWNDKEHQRMLAERQVLLTEMGQHLTSPRLGKEQMLELRKQLTPEENAQLRQEMLHRMQSLSAENKAKLAATTEHSLQKFVSEHGASPEMEASVAELRKLQDQINRVEKDD